MKMKTSKARRKRWPKIHLMPLVRLLEKEYPDGIILSDLAERTGISAPNLSAAFMSDNMHLSKAEAIAKALGYTLVLTYSYNGVYPDDSQYEPSATAGNLYGIEEYGQRMNRSLHSLSIIAGCKRDTLDRAIKDGDMMVATLDRVAEGLGLSVSWEFMEGRRDDE